MKTCFDCHKAILDGENYASLMLNVNGPSDGCEEFAEDEMEVYLCEDCRDVDGEAMAICYEEQGEEDEYGYE